MRLDQPIDVMGKFWLPEHSEEDGVIGRLIIEDGCDITLTLYGVFKGTVIVDYMGGREGNLDRIVGMLFREQSGKNSGCSRQFVTLDGCLFSQSFYDCEILKYKINFVFKGAIYEPMEKVEFDEYSFTSDGLDAFLLKYPFHLDARSVIKERVLPLPENKTIFLGTYQGAKIELILDYKYNILLSSANIKLFSSIKLTTTTPHDVPFFRKIAFKLKQFLSFACDSLIDFKTVKGEIFKNTENPLNIDIYANDSFVPLEEPKLSINNMFLLFVTVEAKFNHLLENWFKLSEEISPALFLYLSIQTNRKLMLESQFLSFAQALENIARFKRGGYKNTTRFILEDELTILLAPIKEIISKRTNFVELVRNIVETRHYYTHNGIDIKPNTQFGYDVYTLMLQTQSIFKLIVLYELGFSLTEIEDIIANNYLLRQQLK